MSCVLSRLAQFLKIINRSTLHSNLTTHLTCDVICSGRFIANFLQLNSCEIVVIGHIWSKRGQTFDVLFLCCALYFIVIKFINTFYACLGVNNITS